MSKKPLSSSTPPIVISIHSITYYIVFKVEKNGFSFFVILILLSNKNKNDINIDDEKK